MQQNTPNNLFAEGVSTAAPDSFQAAIDYLLKGKQQTAATQRQGLFAQSAPVETPTTNVTNVVKDVFGDRYMNRGRDADRGIDPVTGEPLAVGNPFSGVGLFSSRGVSPADWYQRAENARDARDFITGIAGPASVFSPVVGGLAMLGKHGLNYYSDYATQQAKEAASDFYNSGVYDYYSQENVDRDLAAAGYEPSGYSETPITISPDEMSNTYVRSSSGSGSGGGYGNAGISGGYGYSGASSDYGRSGAGSDRD